MGAFADSVFQQVRRIPKGSVATYGRIARMMGRPRSARYVGYALRSNPAPGAGADSVPCHRVVFKDGSLCKGYAFGGPGVQRALLESEGVAFADDDHVDMQASQWNPAEQPSNEANLPTAPPPDFNWEKELGE